MATVISTTEHWLLDKFSRSVQPRDQPQPAKLDWQHFEEKQLYLHLETVTESTQARLESAPRKRVTRSMLVSISFAPLSLSHSQRIPLDSVDLVPFSSPDSLALARPDPAQVPLKAVHRNTTVALRYLSLAPGPLHGAFKRIQIKFASPADATRFIRAIEPFCPTSVAQVKSTLPPPPPSSYSTSSRPATTDGGAPSSRSGTPYVPSDAASTTTGSVRGSSIDPPFSPPRPNLRPPPPPPSHRTATVLPPSFATLFPNLAAIKKKPPPPPTLDEGPEPKESECRTLVSLDDDELEEVIFGILQEDGFAELVGRVQGIVKKQGVGMDVET